jgi:hypothetical protein
VILFFATPRGMAGSLLGVLLLTLLLFVVVALLARITLGR